MKLIAQSLYSAGETKILRQNLRQASLFTTDRTRSELTLNPGHRVAKHERKFTNYVISIVICSLRQISHVTRAMLTRTSPLPGMGNGRDHVEGVKVDEGRG